MPQVDFYVLPDAEPDSRLRFVGRLADKLQRLNKSLYVAVADTDTRAQLDNMLWEYPPESFLPHSMADAEQEAQQSNSPIVLGCGHWRTSQSVYINLRSEPPPHHGELERLVEIVTQAPDSLAASRAHYQFYREQGYAIQSHTIKSV